MSYVTGSVLVCMSLVLGARACPVAGQQRPDPVAGQRVRVTTAPNGARAIGTLVRLDSDSIVIDPDHRAMPLDLINRLEVSRGLTSSTGASALLGFVLFGGVGAGLMFMGCNGVADCPVGTMTLAGGAVLGAVGAGIGALVGSARRESWAAVDVRRPDERTPR